MSDHRMTDDSGSDSDASSSAEAIQVESLVAGRERRSTAGNRLDTLLTREAADDELELLFAEQGEDDEFEAENAEDQSDVQLDSSSDEEDGGDAGAADDELAGERELQQQARAARNAAKRKAEKTLIPLPKKKKKVQIDPEESRLIRKKRAEKIWAPAVLDGAVRQSSRTLSVMNKELVHARLEEGEKRRQMTLQLMDAAAKKREYNKTKPMTQEERLAEAARVEKRNSKSLNRWEEAEKARQAERDAKLAALHDRQMDGPFIRYWSGPAEWVNGRLGLVGRKALQVIEESKKPAPEGTPVENPAETSTETPEPGQGETLEGEAPPPLPVEEEAHVDEDAVTIEKETTEKSDNQEDGPADGPVDAEEPTPAESGPASAGPETPTNADTPAEKPADSPRAVDEPAVLAEVDANRASAGAASVDVQLKVEPTDAADDTNAVLPQLPKSLIREISAKNLVVLENFNAQLVKERDVQRQILFHRRSSKPSKPAKELCVITSRPARYRDPTTGLPYHDRYAFKQIQRLREGKIRWSDLLGCYVGSDEVHARGVPDRFYYRGEGQ